MHYDYDLIIVGGGPAGAIMALSAARQNLRALLLDKARFPRDKVCGDAIPPRSRPLLQAYNLLDAVRQAPHAPVTAEVVQTPTEQLRVQFDEPELIVRRVHFDNVLFQAAKAVVETREGCPVTDLLRDDSGQVCGVVAGPSQKITARVVAGADGFSSIVARRAGLYRYERAHWAVATRCYYRRVPFTPGEYEVHYFDDIWPGYLWIFPVDDEVVNVGLGQFPAAHTERIPLAELHRRLLQSPALRSRFARAEPLGPIRGWNLPLASIQRPLHGDGFILAGDAAGLIDPLRGHGIDAAMLSGQIAGEVLGQICRGSDYRAERLALYAETVWQQLGPLFNFTRRFRERWDNPPPRWQSLSRLETLNKFYFQGRGVLSQLNPVADGTAPTMKIR